MDSVALEALLAASDVLQGCAASLKLASVTATCREVFELTGLSARLCLFNDVQDAVKSFL